VPVGAVDLTHAGAHEARELVEGHTGGDGEGGESVAQGVGGCGAPARRP
jgi:hypothetical protein